MFSSSGFGDPSERGVSVIEFSFVLPLLLILTTGVVNLGSAIIQVQEFSGAVRHGARLAANQSNFETTCSTLQNSGTEATTSYVRGGPGVYMADGWQDAEVRKLSVTWDGLEQEYFEISVGTRTEEDNCLFCYQGIIDRFQVDLNSLFAVEDECT